MGWKSVIHKAPGDTLIEQVHLHSVDVNLKKTTKKQSTLAVIL